MAPRAIPSIIDAHLDLAMNALALNRDLKAPLTVLNERDGRIADHPMRGRATVSLPELRRAGVRLCCATVLSRLRPELFPQGGFSRLDIDFCAPEIAFSYAASQIAYYELLEAQGDLRVVRTREELEAHWQAVGTDGSPAPVGVILSMEGADPIVGPEQVDWWWARGLRVASLVHYGLGPYAGGTGTEGPLTDRGRELLDAFARRGIMLDVTHLSDPAFDEALDHFEGTVLASHSNSRALVPNQRQLADPQIRRLVERGAVIGIVCDAWMLDPQWVRGKSTNDGLTMESLADHVDHICQIAGSSKHVGIGSDLDGLYGNEQTPKDLKTIADLGRLADLLGARGYSDESIDAVFWSNWLGFFTTHLPAGPVGVLQ